MLDQLNSHAQIGIGLAVLEGSDSNTSSATDDRNRHAEMDQGKLQSFVGAKVGVELKRLLLKQNISSNTGATETATSRFCCPLDEALVACELRYSGGSPGTLAAFTLPPYGIYPRTGRKFIGRMETDKLRNFWESLAEQSGLEIRLHKIRGDNAHHIVESAFKAFSRALRNLLDGMDTATAATADKVYGPDSFNHKASVALARQASVERSTKETSIATSIQMDGGVKGNKVDTGIPSLDEFLSTLATNAAMSLSAECKGDLWIDEHHTAEDVSIALGQVLTQAFGTKAGLNRMWSATAQSGDAKVEVTMDLSNRPCFTHNLTLSNSDGDEKVGDLSMEMFEHVLDSLVVNARMTVHIVELTPCENLADTVQAVGMAFGQALKYCAMVDCRRAGATASSKGTLSV